MHDHHDDQLDPTALGGSTRLRHMTEVAATPRAGGSVSTRPAVSPEPDPVGEAIGDGKIAREERTLFERGANADRIDQEQDRLRDAVRASEQRDDSDAPPATRAAHEALSGSIDDQRALVGALEAERVSIESGAPDAVDDYQLLREEAQPWIERFNDNGGQYYQGNDLMGDDWDEAEVDFDRLAGRFTQDPDLLDDFADVQGRHDESIGDDPEGHFAVVAEDDPEDAARIEARYEAAVHLQGVFERYQVAHAGIDASGERVEQIVDEQQELQESIDEDVALLDASTVDLAPAEPVVRPPRDMAEVEAQFPSNTAPVPVPTPTSPPASEQVVVVPTAPTPTTPTSPPASEQVVQAPAATEPVVTTPVETAAVEPAPVAAPTDAELLDSAVSAGIIDEDARERCSFNEAGELVYAAQRGDGYWQAAEHVRPPAGQDFAQHWMSVWNENSMRNSGVPDDPFVGIDQPIAFPCYTRESLLAQS